MIPARAGWSAAGDRPSDSGIGSSDYTRALLNILDDFASEREQLRKTQRAISNILADYAEEKDRLKLVQKAAMNILEDLALEKNRLEASQRDVLRSEQALRASLHEKEVLLREVHHRVKNNLQLIASLLNLQARQIDDQRSRLVMEESQNRIHSIALVHETLYQSGELARINIGDYLGTLVQHLMESWIGMSGRVRLSTVAAALELPLDIAIPCGLIVNELITNALKHAFPGERSGAIRISVLSDAPGRMKLVVEDDGVGLPEHVELGRSGSGLGLQLVATLARQLRGSVAVTRRPGTTVELSLQVPA